MVIDKVEQYFDEDIHQELLGYIMDILVKVKRWKEQNRSLNISKIPRMADWARHCEIIARCMGYEPEEFLNAYRENAKIQTEEIMETSLLATCLAHFVDTDPRFNGKAMVRDLEGKPLWHWVGIATSLKAELEFIAEGLKIDINKSKGWPRNPSWLIRKLNEIIHTLKDAGIEIDYDRTNPKSKIIMIRKLASLASMPSKMENHAQNEDEKLDGILDGKNKIDEMPSQIHAQLDAIDGIDGNLHTLDQKNNSKPRPQATCPKCSYTDDAFYMKNHHCD